MKILRNILLILPILFLHSCRDCASVEDRGVPDRLVRFFDASGNNLWFGDSAIYNPDSVSFVHETLGKLESTAVPGQMAVELKFPETLDGSSAIVMTVAPGTDYAIEYSTLTYNNKCTKVYELSFVKFEGEQVCGVCGDTQFNDDKFINLRLK